MSPGEPVPEAMPPETRRVPPDLRVDGEERKTALIQRRVTFAVEDGGRVTALILVPHNLSGRASAVLALHQTVAHGKEDVAGKGKPSMACGAELAARGYVVLAPDNPNFGENKVDV